MVRSPSDWMMEAVDSPTASAYSSGGPEPSRGPDLNPVGVSVGIKTLQSCVFKVRVARESLRNLLAALNIKAAALQARHELYSGNGVCGRITTQISSTQPPASDVAGADVAGADVTSASPQLLPGSWKQCLFNPYKVQIWPPLLGSPWDVLLWQRGWVGDETLGASEGGMKSGAPPPTSIPPFLYI